MNGLTAGGLGESRGASTRALSPRTGPRSAPPRPQTGQIRALHMPQSVRGLMPWKWPKTGHSGRREHGDDRPHRGDLPGRPRALGRRAGDARPGQDPQRRREILGGDEGRHRRPGAGQDPARSRRGRRRPALGPGSWYPWTKRCGKPTCSPATTAGRDLSTASASTTASATPWRTRSAG